MKKFSHFVELCLGDNQVVLCHFANDVRCDFLKRGVQHYFEKIRRGEEGYLQFRYTNSFEQIEELKAIISSYDKGDLRVQGALSSFLNPLFYGSKVDGYDTLIQGHGHFKAYEESEYTKFWSIRSVGMGYVDDSIDLASYIILKERTYGLGFELEEILVPFDWERMAYHVIASDCPTRTIENFIGKRRILKKF